MTVEQKLNFLRDFQNVCEVHAVQLITSEDGAMYVRPLLDGQYISVQAEDALLEEFPIIDLYVWQLPEKREPKLYSPHGDDK